jgi:hypothetical protein
MQSVRLSGVFCGKILNLTACNGVLVTHPYHDDQKTSPANGFG